LLDGVRSDALIGIEAILAGLDKKLSVGKPTAAAIRTKELAHRIATEPADSMPLDIAPRVLNPREAIRAIDAVVPKDWDIVVGGAAIRPISTPRCVARRRSATRRSVKIGAVGNGLSYALGVAATRWQGREGKIVLFEGDGGLGKWP
jgi:thiamine pyrophosphate-dependent acetolactate synthase large subunit-like protein